MRREAFTLIELLIVVAIIGILAAIAVPNFMNAQTRAKVARAKADLRSLATALESYFLDHNDYPCDETNSSLYYKYLVNPVLFPLTTPTAYLGDITMPDPFLKFSQIEAQTGHDGGHTGSYMFYHYQQRFGSYMETACPAVWKKGYCILSMGPDYQQSGLYFLPPNLVCDNFTYGAGPPYKPSNGLHSWGDIVYFGGDLPVSGALGG